MEYAAKKTTPKFLYFLGPLCFIPALGGFFGVLFIVGGIVVYKNKWLVIIGIVGILFILGFYVASAIKSFNGKEIRESLVSVSQMQLNTMVKNIEFHKLQYGKYPQMLNDLDSDDFFSLQDIGQSFSGRGQMYQYELLNDRYTVFSAGADGIAHTDDDVFPSIKIADSSKVGFVKSLK